ncbi:MAG: hypothetical protein J0M03_15110 [Acidobacteria bacterium]|nr:hypothetical protein [Acidobacteriota bacterium]
MFYKTCFLNLLFLFVVLFLDVNIAFGCSCLPAPPLLDAYEKADTVVITRVVSLEREPGTTNYQGVLSTKMVVEKVFKGNLKIGDQMIFGQGLGGTCVWTFRDSDIDQEFLFYLNSNNQSNFWFAGTCGRSTRIKYATADLLYLNNLKKLQGRTRISGTVRFSKDTSLSVEGREISIIGSNKTYTLKTDQNGVYEIYDLAPGKYEILIEVPSGWKLIYFPRPQNKDELTSNKLFISLENKKHAGFDLIFEIDNVIRGKVYDLNGKPMKDVCVRAKQVQKLDERSLDLSFTDEEGNFEITELAAGDYILDLTGTAQLSEDEQFMPFYYPNTTDPQAATLISIHEGAIIENINIHVPKAQKIIIIKGTLLYSDGNPVDDETVVFKAKNQKDTVENDIRTSTDSNGHFSIKIPKGIKGKLYGEILTYKGEYKNCPSLESLIEQSKTDSLITTSDIEIETTNDLFNIELKYSFPLCKKAKP